MCWTIQIDFGERLFVICCYIWKTINTWVEYVTIEGKAMGSTLRVRWNSATEPVQINFFGGVVEL